MKNKQFFILILLLVIGFASISATLIINGNTKVAANLDDFNVIFIEGFLNGEESPNVEIDSTKKVLTFTTNKLTNINDTARIDYKVKNISTQYDGDVTINCTNEENEYVNVTSSFDGKTLPLIESVNMQAQEVKSGYINAELTKATTEDQEAKITCKIEVNATSRTNYAYSLSFDSNGGSNVEDKVVEYNTSYGTLSTPTKEGYTFIGWFNEDDVRVDESTILDTKGNKTLFAKWKYICPYEVGKKWEFSFTGDEQELLVPCDGVYKLETWGAQGGNKYGYGGYGGYSIGEITLTRKQSLFINVGSSPLNEDASYNEGTSGVVNTEWNYQLSGGGGATHIATKSGLLYTLENDKGSILIVSGAGAGGATYESEKIQGGHAGGFIGSNAFYRKQSDKFVLAYIATGGNQTKGGSSSGRDGTKIAGFGKGTTGGSGYYGGGCAGTSDGIVYTGGGGSSYIGNVLLKNKNMYCYNCKESSAESTKTISTTCTSSAPIPNCSKQGNGYAKITYLSE